jgi:hypothetical protein
MINKLTGGLLGAGIASNIREAYSFITTNYVPGDELILMGFSRGAFTVRSIAGMIHDIGLLTRGGMESFYAIFKDFQNSRNGHYRDKFPDLPFPDKPRAGSKDYMRRYRRRLLELGLTRIRDPDGRPIEVQALAVWDTVGSLGIPTLGWMQAMGEPATTKEMKFYDTALTNSTRNAFQALALDEHRGPFSPAVWERRGGNRTDLRQVWFPGAHSNVGGGYADQEIADVSLAWMMDQLSSVGVSFQPETIDRLFLENVRFYEDEYRNSRGRLPPPFAQPDIDENFRPIRPWALGKVYDSDTGFYRLTQRITRTPGEYCRADPVTGRKTGVPMVHTNERIHRSVRIRLELEGLGLDDRGGYDCPALLPRWKLVRKRLDVRDPIPRDAGWCPSSPVRDAEDEREGMRWCWEWNGRRSETPGVRVMVEEGLGPWERRLLGLSTGKLSSSLAGGDFADRYYRVPTKEEFAEWGQEEK